MEAVIRPTALKVALDKHRRSKVIAGASSSKGSSSGGSEADDTLESKAFMSILDLLGEGQIGGLVDNSPKSIFLNDTPLMSNTGQYNFDDVTWAILTGAQIQDSLGEGFDNAEFAQTLNQLVKNSTPLTFTITDPNASQVRVVVATPALISTDSKGNINGTSVRFTFALSLNSGPFEELGVGQITGKTRSRYQREYSHVLPKTTSTGAKVTSWTIRVARTSPDSTSSSIQNDLYVDSYSVAVGSRLTYPNSAIVGINFNAEQFSSVPSRSYLVDGLLIKVPTNYDPKTRSYTGVWDGTFKLAVTDNPAWILYDVITNARYGLGSFIDPSLANPARLYAIGRYCDEMVDDGFGKKEPRFSINTCINSRADAYQLISDISSVFNGMTYWTGGLLGYMADMPTEVSMVYSAANVIDGLFNYSGAARKDMHSVVLVTWNDPERNYQTSVEYVEDQSLIERFGIRKAEITSFGCTSRGQAHRIGKWLLYTERYQSKTISFNVGIDSAFVLPGDVVKIVDADRAGARLGGRLKKVVADFAVLDAPVDTKLIKANTTISMRLPDGSFIERLIKSVGVDASTGEQIIYWDTALTKLPLVNAMWVISSPDLEPQLARIVAVGQGQNPGEFSITAIPHNPEKFDHIESDILLETPVTSLISPSVIEPTASVTVVQEARIDQGITVRDMSISWEQVPNAVSYEVKYRKGEGNWLALPATKGLSVDVQNIYQGEYQAQVTAISATGSKSRVTYSDLILLDGQVSTLPKLAIFTAKPVQFGIELDWQYGSGTSGVAQTEIYSSLDGKTFTLMGAYPDPTKHHAINGLYVASTIWFKARIADKYGNYGEWSSVVSASPDISPDKVLDVLSNSIGPSQLSSTVNDKIENTLTTAQKAVSDAAAVSKEVKAEVAARVDALTAVNTAISDETTARTTAIANEAESRAAAISAGIAQEVNDRAAAITAESAKLAKSIAQEVTDRKAAVSTESTNRTNAIKAESTARTNAIAKEVSDRNAAIKVQVDALVAADAAEAAARSNEIASNVSALNATITANVKALNDGITQEITDRKSGDTAVLGELNAYKTSNDTSVAAVLEKAETAISNDAATASKLTGLESTVKSNDTAVRALVASETKTRTSADTALSGRIDSLTTTVNDNNTSVTGKIADVVNSVSTLEGNVNTKTTELANQISDNDNAAKGLIQDVAKSVTTLEGSTNTKISQLQSSLNTTNTNVSKKADATTLNALDSKVTNIDSKTTSNTSAITALQGRASTIEGNVAKKADAAALTALTTRVTNAENENVSQSNSMISLKNSFTAEQGRGANLIANGSFDTDASLDGLAKFQLVDGGHNGTAKCMKSLPGADYGEIHFKTIRGFVGPRTFKVQFATKIVEKSDTLGQVELQIAYKRAGDENFTQFPFVRRNLSGLEVDADWVITTGFITIPAEANTLLFRVVSAPNTTSGSFLIDSCCFYDVTEAYDAQKQADANSAAISGLDSSVSEINGKLTAQASSNTQLQSNINAVDAKAGTAINNAANAQQTANTAVTKADSAAQATATLKSSYDTKMSALDQADRDATAKITQTNADLTSAKTTLANADKALGGRIDTLTATVSNNKTSTDASIKSATDSIATLNNAVTTKTDILTASIKAANVASGDLIPNPTFDPAYDQMGFTVVASTDSGVPKDCPFPYVAKLTGRDHFISGAHNIPCKAGDVFELSALVACGAGNYDFNLFIYRRPTATSTQFMQTDSGGNVKAASATTWKRATWRWTVPENPNPFFTPFLQINQNNGQGGVWYATDWHVINVTAAAQAQSKANANATAISGINASVDTINGALTSQSSSIASLQNAVTDINTKTGQLTNATAAAQSTANSAVSANQSLSERVDALTTTVGNNDATVKGQIQDVAKSVTSLEGSTNTKIGTLQSSINNLAVGGVNLFAFAKLKNGYITGAGDFSATAGTGCQKATDYYIEVGSNKYLTYQLWNPSLLVNTTNSARIAFFDANKKLLKVSELTRLSTALAYYKQTWELPAGTVYVRLNAVLNTNNAALPSPNINVQFEWGNLPTAWTPALEDTQAQFDANATAIDSTKTEVSRVNGVVVAQGNSISKLQSDLNTVDAKTDSAISNAATAQTTANTAVSANNAVAERVSNLETSLDTVKGDVVNKANSSAVEALTNRVTDVEGELTTQASDMTNLQASLNVTDAKANNALPKVSGLDKYKTFKNVLGYYLANGNYSGNLVIQTPITISQKMCNVSIKGYNYRTDGASIDLNVGFYANSASSQIVSSGVVNNGTFPVKVRLGVRGSKVVIILSTSGYNFAYSQFAVDAEIGYTTVPDDWVNGWSCFTSAESDLASVQGISNIINPSQFNPRTEIASNVAATNALTTRVTNAENTLTAQATRTTNLETALSATSAAVDTKASQSALDTLDNQLSIVDGKVTANTNSINSLKTSVNSVEGQLTRKVDASTLADYYTKVQADQATAGQINKYDASLAVDSTNIANSPNVGQWVSETDGTLSSDSSQIIYPLIAIRGSTKYYISTSSGQMQYGHYAIYDADKKFVTGGVPPSAGVVIDTPSNAAYITISYAFALSGAGELLLANSGKPVAFSVPFSTMQAAFSTYSSAIQSTNTNVTNINGKVTANSNSIASQASRLTAVENGVKTKAENSAVQTLNTEVTRIAGELKSTSESSTNLGASIKALPVGGGNLLVNGDFSLNDISPWVLEKSGDDVNATAVVLQKGNLDAWQADAGPSKTVSVHCSNSFTQDQGKWLEFYQTVPVVGGKMYQFSAYTGSHRCRIEMFSRQFDANGNPLLATYTPNDADTVNEDGTTGTRNGGKLLSGYKRLKQNFQAHASATTVRFVLRLMLRQDSYMFMTRAMFAEIADINANPLAWIESGSGAALSSAANASAVQSMRATVDATSSKVTSLAEQNTALQAGLQSANGAIATKAEQSALNTTNSVLNTVSGKVETQAQSINTLTSKTTTMANDISNTELLARAMSSGKLLFGDPTFKTGTNGTTVYNNASNGAVTVARVAKQSSNPTSSGYEMKITVTGAAAPALGGFVQTISSRANAVFLIKYIICLPLGYALYTAANAMGDGASDKFIGNVNGTGKYETYYRLIKCGSTGTFNTTGFVYVAGPTPSAQSPLNWYLASIEAYDTTDFDDMTPQLRTTVAEVQSKVNTLTTNTGATAEKVESMSAYFNPGETVDGSGTADSGNNGAVRWTYHSMIAEGDLANAKAIDNMKAEMDGTFAEWGQVINSEVRQGISAVSEQLNHVSTTLNDQTTRIDTVMASIDGVYGKYVVKIDNNGVLSGFELVSQGGDDGQVVSTFGVNADDFYIGSPATGKRPFIVTTTPRVINGVTYPPGTWIDSAYIAEASIQMAHIDKASITSLSAISATIGTLRTATTGARTEISDNLIQVYDENNVLRVRIGVWS